MVSAPEAPVDQPSAVSAPSSDVGANGCLINVVGRGGENGSKGLPHRRWPINPVIIITHPEATENWRILEEET